MTIQIAVRALAAPPIQKAPFLNPGCATMRISATAANIQNMRDLLSQKNTPVQHCTSKGRFNSLPVIEVSK